MPAVHFKIQWPDGEQVEYYSPSTIIHQFFISGQIFTLSDFSIRVDQALNQASERVREKFGYYCSAASGEQQKIHAKLKQLQAEGVSGQVTVLGFRQ